jgi:uncharacterized membrane protein
MKNSNVTTPRSKLEPAISYLLIIGVLLSLLLEVAGVCLYFYAEGNLSISFDSSVYIQGQNFFRYIYSFWHDYAGNPAMMLMAAGVVVLILTPFSRIILSVIYFGWEKNWKYVIITLFVLVVITVSLITS